MLFIIIPILPSLLFQRIAPCLSAPGLDGLVDCRVDLRGDLFPADLADGADVILLFDDRIDFRLRLNQRNLREVFISR